MRVVLVMPTFPTRSEGFLVGKFVTLLKKGWDVHILCSKSERSEWKNFPELEQIAGIAERVHVDFPHAPTWRAIATFPVALIRAVLSNPAGLMAYVRGSSTQSRSSAVKQLYLDLGLLCLSPDLVHFQFDEAVDGRKHFGTTLQCPMVVSFRGDDINRSSLDKPGDYDRLWKSVSSVHFPSEALRNRAIGRGFDPGNSHVLIPPSIDIEFFRRSQSSENPGSSGGVGRLKILSVGRMNWEKGYEYALEAAWFLKERGVNFELRILGDGPMFEGLCFHRHRLGLEAEVIFLGAQDRIQVKREMQQADVFLHASVSEGFCNSVLEAQAMELAVVCSDAGGLPEHVQHGITGLVVPRRDAGALAGALEKLASDADLRGAMGREGRRRVTQLFDLNTRVTQFEEWYRSIAGLRCASPVLNSEERR